MDEESNMDEPQVSAEDGGCDDAESTEPAVTETADDSADASSEVSDEASAAPGESEAAPAESQAAPDETAPDDEPPAEAVPAESPAAPTDAAAAPAEAPTAPTDAEIAAIVEAILFTTDAPLPPGKIAQVGELPGAKAVRAAIATLNERYEQMGCAFRIDEIGGGFQMLTQSQYHDVLERLTKARSDSKLSQAALETLAIIAYRQPILRADVEAIRGVASGEVLRGLLEKGLVKIVGRAEVIGRPMLYGTTRKFLEVFGLGALEDLPRVEELRIGAKEPAATPPAPAQGPAQTPPSASSAQTASSAPPAETPQTPAAPVESAAPTAPADSPQTPSENPAPEN
jgi:segregation and condensation protein B